MHIYAYSGLTAQGKAVSGVIDADSPKGARLSLRRDGIFPTGVDEEQIAASSGTTETASFTEIAGRISAQDLAVLTRQLATLVRAGLPLIECLGAIIEQMEQAKLKRVFCNYS